MIDVRQMEPAPRRVRKPKAVLMEWRRRNEGRLGRREGRDRGDPAGGGDGGKGHLLAHCTLTTGCERMQFGRRRQETISNVFPAARRLSLEANN